VAQGNSTSVEYDSAGNETSASFWPRPGDDTFNSANISRSYSCRNLLAASAVQTVNAASPCSEGHYCPPNPVVRTTFFNYLYDGRGARVYGSSGAVFGGTEYLYTPELQLHRIHDSFDRSTEFIRFNGRPVAQIEDGPRFTFTDHLGTPLLQVDPDSNVVWRAEYEPYGRIYRFDTSNTNQPLRFAGQDVASPAPGGVEEHYNIFRWYRPGWGRYTQDDPRKFSVDDVSNNFAYADGNPLRRTDPLGLYSVNDFSDRDAEKLNRAIKRVWDFLQTKPCCLTKYPFSFFENLRNQLLTTSFNYDAQTDDCANAKKYTNHVNIGAQAFTGNCPPCLASTVLHELAHAAGGATDRSNSSPLTGPSSNQIERDCGSELCRGQ